MWLKFDVCGSGWLEQLVHFYYEKKINDKISTFDMILNLDNVLLELL